MFQHFINRMLHVITSTFFKRIDVVGDENVPEHGPVIFAGNHPNALMDGWLLTARCGRWPLHFIANAKLWNYPLLGRLLDASGAVPVYRKEEHDGEVDNSGAFDRLFEVIEAGDCIGVFPEGVSHTESQLVKLKTGTARIALSVAARGKVRVTIMPCGLNYMHRDRFRSQVLIEFGEPIVVADEWVRKFEADERAAVIELTVFLAGSLKAVTLNAPDWTTLRFIQAARRLYKPRTAHLTPATYVELNRRFVETWERCGHEPEMLKFRQQIEDYQSRLEALGLKDYQLRQEITVGKAFRRLVGRSLLAVLLLPVAIPGLILHLPAGWIAAAVGDRFSYETDDIATLKVFAAVAVLPLLYIIAAFLVGNYFGLGWALFAVAVLAISFSTSLWLIETQASLLASMISILRRTRLRAEIQDLRNTRSQLVNTVRELANKFASSHKPRIFTPEDLAATAAKNK
tara:strand:+ start:75 stop:1448 length:1374 start_codon:yes stop_codon:yes gene_type:complete